MLVKRVGITADGSRARFGQDSRRVQRRQTPQLAPSPVFGTVVDYTLDW